MSSCIMGLTTQDPYILKEHIELYKIVKFRVNWANIEQDTAIQKLQNTDLLDTFGLLNLQLHRLI